MNTLKVNYCIEDLKYRVFGLFPFFTKDLDGKLVLCKGNTRPDGCYGQLACDMTLPQDCGLTVGDETVLEGKKTYSYRTLLRYYNKYKHLKDEDFIRLMNEGIGYIRVSPIVSNDTDVSKWDLVPQYINMSECGDLYGEMSNLKLIHDRYVGRADKSEVDCELECLSEKYERMGGDTLLGYYKSKSEESDEVADKFYELAEGNSDTTSYSIDMCITGICHDIGSFDYYYETDEIDETDETNNDGDYEDIETDDEKDIKITGYSDSKLKSFRCFSDYIDGDNVIQPGLDSDWLWYYKNGYLSSYSTSTDVYGNIEMIDGAERVTEKKATETNLMAYGDILIGIAADNDKCELTFTYVLGAHLKAELKEIDQDEFGYAIFKYGDYEYDESDKYHGVTYVETYKYKENGDIYNLVENEQFDDYIGNRVNNKDKKCEFDLSSVIAKDVSIINGQPVQYNYIPSSFTAFVKPNDALESDVSGQSVYHDFYDGVVCHPQVKNNVRFSRGNAAAFERHIKLGEVKSFDDFLNYSNGGFFNVM